MPPADLLDHKLLFVSGKGGVGKSTVAAALALLGAQRGKRTLACEIDAKGNLADFFEAGDTDYTNIENQIASWTSNRDALATTIKNTLADSEFNGVELNVNNAQSLISQANALINEVVAAAS